MPSGKIIWKRKVFIAHSKVCFHIRRNYFSTNWQVKPLLKIFMEYVSQVLAYQDGVHTNISFLIPEQTT